MTREEILNMPAGREMDALIEKVIFERTLTNSGNNASYIKYPNGYADLRLNKNYSTDIGAAWEVIQKMHEMKYKYTLHGHFMGSELQVSTFDHQDWADANPLYKAIADTAPLAICRAALLAKVAK